MEKLLLSLGVLIPYLIVAEGGCLDIYPKKTEILKYSAMEINCTIKESCGQGYSSRDLYYTEYYGGHIGLNSSWTVELGNKSLGLRLPNTTLLHSSSTDKYVYCHLGDKKVYAKFTIVDLALEKMDCKVLNMNMRCEWGAVTGGCNKVHLTLRLRSHHPYPINIKVLTRYAYRGSPNSSFDNCTVKGIQSTEGLTPDECTWKLPAHGVYELHAFGYSIDVLQFTLNTTQIERPLAVEEVHFTRIGARSVDLSWPPKGIREQLYHVAVSTQGRLITRMNSTWTNVSFDDLHPYTEYVINVSSSYITNGQWSDVKQHRFMTLSDVPDQHPEVSAGGWFNDSTYVAGDTRCRTVNLIFKDIQDREQNAPSFQYVPRVNVHSNENGSCFNCSKAVASHPQKRTVVIPNNCDVSVVVLSKNQNGTATGTPQAIWIPHNVIPWPVNVNVTIVATNDNLVRVGWSPWQSALPTTGYTVYWYHNSLVPYLYDFLTMGPEADHANITLPDGHHYRQFKFGISRQTENSSTGVRWMQDGQDGCIYDILDKPAPPEDLHTTPADNSVQLVHWKTPTCAVSMEGRGYPYGYHIRLHQLLPTSTSLLLSRFVEATTDGKMKYTLEEMKHGVKYLVQIHSIAVGGWSANVTRNFTYKAPDNRRTLYYLLLLICVPVIFASCSCFLWRCKKMVKKWREGVKITMCDLPTWSYEGKPVIEGNDMPERYYFKDPTDSSSPSKGYCRSRQTHISRQKKNDHVYNNNNKPYSAMPVSDRSLTATLLGFRAARQDSVKEDYIPMDGGKNDAVNYSYMKNGMLVPVVPTSGSGDKDMDINSPPVDSGHSDCSLSCAHVRPQEFSHCEVDVTNGYVVPTDSPPVDNQHFCDTHDYVPHYPASDVQLCTEL